MEASAHEQEEVQNLYKHVLLGVVVEGQEHVGVELELLNKGNRELQVIRH